MDKPIVVPTKSQRIDFVRETNGATTSGKRLVPMRFRTGRKPRSIPEAMHASRTAGMITVSVLKIQPIRATT